MARRRDALQVRVRHALAREANALAALVWYGVRLDATARSMHAHERLREVAAELGVDAPPPLAEVNERPELIEEWAVRTGVRSAATQT